MSSFAIYAFASPIIGTALFIAFALYLARRDRVLYERYLAGAAQRQADDAPRANTEARRPKPLSVDA